MSDGKMLHPQVSNGQGGVLSPLHFSRYIRDLLHSVAGSGVGCFIGDQCANILAYADDLVLLAPSWYALQLLLNILSAYTVLLFRLNLQC